MGTSPASALALSAAAMLALTLSACNDDAEPPSATTSRVIEDAPALAEAPVFTPPVVDIHAEPDTGSDVSASRKMSCDDITPLEANASRDTAEGRWWPVDGGWVLADGSWCV